MVAQIYVDDIVFGGMSDKMVKHFANQMQAEFEMSLIGELTYFLGLQVTQMEDSTFLHKASMQGILSRSLEWRMPAIKGLLLLLI